MKPLASLWLFLLTGCTLQTGTEHTSRVEAVLEHPYAYSAQAIIVACIIVIAFGVIHHWYKTKDRCE